MRVQNGCDPSVSRCALLYLYGPDGLLQRVEELEAEAVLLGGPLDQLARVEQHRSHPLAVFVGFVDE